MGPAADSQSTPPGPKRRRGLIAILLVILCLLLLEAAARYIFYNHFPLKANRDIKIATGQERSPMSMQASALWHHLPNPEFYRGKLSRFQTRGPDFQVPKPDREYRIICVGDSTTFGWKNAVGHTYPHFLQRILVKKFPGRRIKVINAGVPGFNSAFALSYLALRLVHFQPDLVIIKLGYNDIFAYLTPGLGLDYTNLFPRPFEGRIRDRKFWRLARHVYILRFIGHWLLDPPVERNAFLGVWDLKDWRRSRLFPGYDKKISIFSSYLLTMVALCNARNIPVILLDLPYSRDKRFYWPEKKDATFGLGVQGLYDLFSKVIGTIIKKQDLRVMMVRTANKLGPGDFWDHIHNTPRGNHKIARLVAEKILAHPGWTGLRDRPR